MRPFCIVFSPFHLELTTGFDPAHCLLQINNNLIDNKFNLTCSWTAVMNAEFASSCSCDHNVQTSINEGLRCPTKLWNSEANRSVFFLNISDIEVVPLFNIMYWDCVFRFNYCELWFITRIVLIWHQYFSSCQVVGNQQETCLLKCYTLLILVLLFVSVQK